ncbi:A disintegrin and metalloproteinase with thrombospondin motifs adt-1-like isoform X2 [Magallana gigas]|uniref:A disintegrin and metalloproteinase with thrombospondin motifs adt-1-like isoform X2 n=1 Tax=Magallana gigas TaxID=29159 RepID=UPI0033426024
MESKFTLLFFVLFFAGKGVHGQTQWSSWTPCDRACDTGLQSRARECPEGDSSCAVIETRKCNVFSCIMTTMLTSTSSKTAPPPTLPLMTLPVSSLAGLTTESGVHGQTQWSSWTPCDRACDTGLQSRARECPEGDSSCAVIETRKCNVFSCIMTTMLTSTSSKTAPPPTLPLMTLPLSSLAGLTTESGVHGQTQWSSWTPCDKECDTGTKSRARECPEGDSSCAVIETRKCNVFSCIMTTMLTSTSSKTAPPPTLPLMTRPLSSLAGLTTESGVHGQTQWSSWTPCDRACDTGLQSRARECPEGDSSCAVIETRKCNVFSCIMTTMLTSTSSKTAPPPTLPLMTLPLSSLAGLTTESDVQEKSSELTTLLTKPAPQNVRSTTTSSTTTTTTTTTMATKHNTKSGSTPLHLNYLIAIVLFWYMI